MLFKSMSLPALGLAIGIAGTGAAHAESGWQMRHGDGRMWAEVPSASHGSTLSVSCDDANHSIALNLQPPASWNGNAGYRLNLVVDGKVFPAVADGADDGVVLSNLPKEAIGIDRSLRRAMKAGKLIVLEGPPAAGIPVKQRSFALGGADSAIARIESGCPGVR